MPKGFYIGNYPSMHKNNPKKRVQGSSRSNHYRAFLLFYLVLGASSTSTASVCASSATATAQADLDNLSSCKTFSGDLVITGSIPTAVLNGIQAISGSLTIQNATDLTSFSAPSLQEIDQSFVVNIANRLNDMNCPELTKVGTINWVAMPQLQQLTFTKGVSTASSITISDTGLTSLSGITVNNVATFDINNNQYLQTINVDLETVSNELSLSYNSNSVAASFPNLQWANNVTFQDISSISLPNITTVNASMGFINNTLTGLSFPQLTNVGQSLSIISNNQLTNASFPALTAIGGGFIIANNTALSQIGGFPLVESVGGAIDFVGNFSVADLPKLDLVKGGVDVESSASNFSCNAWDSLHSAGDIHGDSYVCKGATHSTSVALTGSQTTGGVGSATKAAAATTGSSSKAGVAMPVIEYSSVFGALACFIFQYV